MREHCNERDDTRRSLRTKKTQRVICTAPPASTRPRCQRLLMAGLEGMNERSARERSAAGRAQPCCRYRRRAEHCGEAGRILGSPCARREATVNGNAVHGVSKPRGPSSPPSQLGVGGRARRRKQPAPPPSPPAATGGAPCSTAYWTKPGGPCVRTKHSANDAVVTAAPSSNSKLSAWLGANNKIIKANGSGQQRPVPRR